MISGGSVALASQLDSLPRAVLLFIMLPTPLLSVALLLASVESTERMPHSCSGSGWRPESPAPLPRPGQQVVLRSVSNGSAQSAAQEDDSSEVPSLRAALPDAGSRSPAAAPAPQPQQLVALRPTPSRALADDHSDSEGAGACQNLLLTGPRGKP